VTSVATAPKYRELFRATPNAPRLIPIPIGDSTSFADYLRWMSRGHAAPVFEMGIEAAEATRDLFPITPNPMPTRDYVTEPFYRAFIDSELLRGTQLRSYGGSQVIKARVPGHYYTHEAMAWPEVSYGSCFEQDPGRTITWVGLSEATTWEGALEANDPDNFLGQGVRAQIQTAIRAARGEHFENGYESQFRKTLGRMYRALGSRLVEAVCDEIETLGIGDEILAQVFKFLVDVRDSTSADLRLVSIAQFLRSKSVLTRDAAATALDALDDRRAAVYLRDAAARESHPMLKCEFLEIAAELEAE